MGMDREKPLEVVFYKTGQDNQPVKEFLKERSREEKRVIGSDIYKVQMGFPMGEPLVKPVKTVSGVWEVRSTLPNGICRVFFTITSEPSSGEKMVLLHAIIKKTQKTPPNELKTVKTRLKDFNARLKAQQRPKKGKGE
jgi:phage-related protein